MRRPEILAPAGDFIALQAAIDAGADAVYFGLGTLNMRARSTVNFKEEDLPEIAERCRGKVKAYLTLNAIIFESELEEVERLIVYAKPYVDAFIVSDWGVISLCKKHGVEIHVSTQMSTSNSSGVAFLASQGVSRVVLARECTLAEVKEKHGDKIAFSYFDKKRKLHDITYGQFLKKIKRIAAGLTAQGYAGKRIAIIGETSVEWVSSYLAILATGGVAIPMDKELEIEVIEGFLDSVEAEAIVYSGSFNGQGHTISGLYNGDSDSYVGLFGYTENATIKNVTIENVDMKLVGNASWAGGHMGALVGNIAGNTVIENINITGDVKIDGDKEKAGAGRIGGVIGGNTTNASFKNVYVNANEGSFVSGNNSIGGIAGQLQGKSVFENCSSNIDVTAAQFYAGGIIGYTNQDIIQNSETYSIDMLNNANVYGKTFDGEIIQVFKDGNFII